MCSLYIHVSTHVCIDSKLKVRGQKKGRKISSSRDPLNELPKPKNFEIGLRLISSPGEKIELRNG